ncbi:M23 family metallopeptidase [Streptomyces otsuchiensis]|uniref:M23 family metallopeptidase n=1 Tax=Streptomyces otsuchiensis TaxID=2681388 RepID=UPI001D13162F|nr:M23 family metallopeptidase [Streptomyces otsuchiensis]
MASNRHAAGEDPFGSYGQHDPYGSYGSYGSYPDGYNGHDGSQSQYGPHTAYGDGAFGDGGYADATAPAASTAYPDTTAYGMADSATAVMTEPLTDTEPSALIDTTVPAHAYFSPDFGPERVDDGTDGEWNPGTETLVPVRGRHRVGRQRGGTMARSRAVLGVGVIAAVGAGGMASANEGGAPGLGGAADKVKAMPDKIGGFFGSDGTDQQTATLITAAPLTSAGLMAGTGSADTLAADQDEAGDPGEALRSRILKQAEAQDALAEAEQRDAAVGAAIANASADAATFAEEERVAEEERQEAEKERKRKEAEEKKRKEEEERLAKLAASFTAPLSNYSLSASYGQSGAMWASGYHTGLDFSAPAGTPVKNIHTGTVTEAAWAGSYGYRVTVKLDDGTELSYSHLSSMSAVAGQKVTTGDVIGHVGSTGNSSGPHLHLEVRPGGGSTIDPLSWMRNNGIQV